MLFTKKFSLSLICFTFSFFFFHWIRRMNNFFTSNRRRVNSMTSKCKLNSWVSFFSLHAADKLSRVVFPSFMFSLFCVDSFDFQWFSFYILQHSLHCLVRLCVQSLFTTYLYSFSICATQAAKATEATAERESICTKPRSLVLCKPLLILGQLRIKLRLPRALCVDWTQYRATTN